MAKPLYPDCTYHCNQGQYFDDLHGKMVPCEFCTSRRNTEVRDGILKDEEGVEENLTEALGFSVKSAPLKIIEERIIPQSERDVMNYDTVVNFFNVLNAVMDRMRLGNDIPTSVVFGLPREGRFDLIAHPILVAAYKSGKKISPITTTGEYIRARSRVQSGDASMAEETEFYEKYFDTDVLIVILPSGVSEREILAGKSIMQERAVKSRSTMFLTTSPESSISELVGTRYGHDGTRFETEPSNYVARGVFATYDKKKGNQNRWTQAASEDMPSEISMSDLKEASSKSANTDSGNISFGSAAGGKVRSFG